MRAVAETYQIRNSYSDFLHQKAWDYFATVTCRKPRTDTLAFIRDFNNSLPVVGDKRAFVAVEPHKTGMIHIHSLLYFEQAVSPEGKSYYHPSAAELQSNFDNVFGRSRVSTINSYAEVSNYCSKYVTKRTNQGFEYDFLGDYW